VRRTPVLIVGGGPAGAAAATVLARAGVRPELIERSAGPHEVVCGGFVGWDSLRLLERIGLDVPALGARPITRLRLVAGERTIETALPRPAAGLSRRCLDAALLALAERAGAGVRRGEQASAADPRARTVRVSGSEIACDALFVATGKRELRGTARELEAGRARPAIGLRASLPASPGLSRALADTIELHLFDGGYAGLLLQEDGSANLCLSLTRLPVGAAGGAGGLLERIVRAEPILGDRVGADLPSRIEATAGVPYGWRSGATVPGVFRLGDQAAVIASLAGDGIAIGLASGESAAAAYLADGAAGAVAWQRRFRRQALLPIATAERLRHVAENVAWRRALLPILALAPSLAGYAAALTRIDRG
jgi:flavin-dependent dehydrogenase